VSQFSSEDRAALVAACARVAASGLVVGSAGNLSLRRGQAMLITPRGAQLEAVDPTTCVEVELRDGSVDSAHAGVSLPSSETPLHRAVYAVTEAHAVVHTHSHYCTVLSTVVDELPAIHYAITAFGGPIRVAEYATFGTDAIANSVATALVGRTAALMANHGSVVVGRDIDHAVAMALSLEWIAHVYYDAICVSTPRLLSPEQLDDVVSHSRELRYGLAETSA
jgi:L-fuculose-phosphate aldolase